MNMSEESITSGNAADEPKQRYRWIHRSTLVGIWAISSAIAIIILATVLLRQGAGRSAGGIKFTALDTTLTTNSISNTVSNNITTAVAKTEDLLLLISITSGPSHAHLRLAARESWLIPCMLSATCDYIFFVDRHVSNITQILTAENKTFGDLVFRGHWCPFMIERHHHQINYGNVMETEIKSKNKSEPATPMPEYQLRAMYKVDWKVCFTKWALQNHKMAAYHAYVEDDSFTCVDNLLHQLSLLIDLQNNGTKVPSIRAGTPMWDGFDDSSTLMSRDIAMVFATLYPSAGFNCSKMADSVDKPSRDWLSWGNSWMGNRCGWRDKLKALGVEMVVPELHKIELHCEGAPAPTMRPTKTVSQHRRRQLQGQEYERNLSSSNQDTFDDITPAINQPPSRRLYTPLPCPKFGGAIIHHGAAGATGMDRRGSERARRHR